jgi:hypothetical protein
MLHPSRAFLDRVFADNRSSLGAPAQEERSRKARAACAPLLEASLKDSDALASSQCSFERLGDLRIRNASEPIVGHGSPPSRDHRPIQQASLTFGFLTSKQPRLTSGKKSPATRFDIHSRATLGWNNLVQKLITKRSLTTCKWNIIITSVRYQLAGQELEARHTAATVERTLSISRVSWLIATVFPDHEEL